MDFKRQEFWAPIFQTKLDDGVVLSAAATHYQ